VTFLTVFVVPGPLVVVFAQALFPRGMGAYFRSPFRSGSRLSAIRLTLLVAVISVSLNLVFGVIAAWAIAKFDFRGKTFPDLADRFAVSRSARGDSPALSSCCCFGRARLIGGPWLQAHNIHVLFCGSGHCAGDYFRDGSRFVARAPDPA